MDNITSNTSTQYILTPEEQNAALMLRGQIENKKALAYDLRMALKKAEEAILVAKAVYDGAMSCFIQTKLPGGQLTQDLSRIVKKG